MNLLISGSDKQRPGAILAVAYPVCFAEFNSREAHEQRKKPVATGFGGRTGSSGV